ncbi:MAG TPA: gamma carbonic anhydrase family protein [Acidimicrobiales bacterium]|nr:gamma carbonic anhydrase family protein [Acidimicrobiales bacterium]
MSDPTVAGPLVAPWQDRTPVVAPDAFVASGAVVIGAVELGARSSVWYGCVLRGDEEPIVIGADTNLQDGTLVHTSGGVAPTVVAEGVVVGHGAVLHSASIGPGVLVGMRATVLDLAVVGEGAIVAAGAVVSPRTVIPAGELWAGTPARKVRDVRPDEHERQRRNVARYVEQAAAHRAAGLGG